MEEKFRSREIRRQILKILHAAAEGGQTESGSWLNLRILWEVLSSWKFDLSEMELRRHCVYLSDPEIRCIDIEKLPVAGKKGTFIYRYRITAKGTRVVEGDETVPGVADE